MFEPVANNVASEIQIFFCGPGEIVWMVVVDDDDADLDEAFAVTRVLP